MSVTWYWFMHQKMMAALKILALTLLVLISPAAIYAQFIFTTNNGAITITGYTGTSANVVIPNSTNGYPVRTIGDGSDSLFTGTTISNVVVGTNVTLINSWSFNFISSLTGITIPNSVTNIGSYSFIGCIGLTNITFPTSLTQIGDGAFSGCTSLTNIVIPASVTNIGSSPFNECFSMNSITVNTNNPAYKSPGGVLFNKSQTTLINCPAGFSGGYQITNTVTYIGANAFDGCSNLTAITIPNSVTNIGEAGFQACSGIGSVTIPNRMTSIGTNVFYVCSSLTNVIFPANLTNIDIQAFGSCSISSFTSPNNLVNIGGGAFGGCVDLTNVVIGGNVTSIGDGAFDGCNLAGVFIPAGVTNIGGTLFRYCTNMTAITVASNNPDYASLGGVLFNKSLTTLIECPFGLTGNYTIPGSVTSIGSSAFQDGLLNSVTFPASVTYIGDGAFSKGSTDEQGVGKFYFLGSPPTLGSEVFNNNLGADVYYLPGIAGWDSVNWSNGWSVPGAELSVLPWYIANPSILNQSSSFGLKTNNFGFTISWATNVSVVVEAATNLVNPVWLPVSTNTLNNGSSYFSDSKWTNYPRRFYRVSSY